MGVSGSKFGFDSDKMIDVVNLKLPTEMFGSFGVPDGVYPTYHMNKPHWISVPLPDAPEEWGVALTPPQKKSDSFLPKGIKLSFALLFTWKR